MNNNVSLTKDEARVALAGLQMHTRWLKNIRDQLPQEPEALALNQELTETYEALVEKIKQELGLNRRYSKP